MPQTTDPPQQSDANTASPTGDRWKGPLRIFQPDPPAAKKITDPAAVAASYKSNQRKILIGTMLGYAAFYFVRKNLGVAMPMMEEELGVTKVQLGTFLTLNGIIYGVSKFANGFLGDRCNGRVFMVAGLMACIILNLAFALSAGITSGMGPLFGISALVWGFGLIWMVHGWFQGMGFPPCARLLTHWIPPKILATRMSIWNTSHSIGAAGVVGLGGVLVAMGFGWKAMFFVPAAVALCVALYLWMTLQDTPESLGLPPVETLDKNQTEPKKDVDPETAENLYESLEDHPKPNYMKRVFTNPYIWIIALANFFVYTVRNSIFDWAPTIFSQAKGFELSEAAWITATFEITGIVGMLAAGWITDNIFGGRGARTCLFYMVACTASVFALWKLPLSSGVVATGIMALAGFFIYGPQALVGIAVANLATKNAAATAVGLTGLFGYLSGTVSGVGLGYVAQHYGWSMGFQVIFISSILGTLLFAIAWFAPAHGYSKSGMH